MIYLDHAATTPLDPRVFEAMLPYLAPGGVFGNPASAHAAGLAARRAVEHAREQVASLLGAGADEIIFTSGATESNNLAIKGALEFRGLENAHAVTSRTEHKCVLDTYRYLETRGLRVTYLAVDARGVIENEAVLAALTPETAIVSLMWVNNETGVTQDIAALAPALRARGVLLHVDAAQAAGKLPIDLAELPIDLLSLSAHKLHGPKGAGALFVRRRPRARLAPQMHGGGHEQGMRSGTLATHQVVGFGAAAQIARDALAGEAPRLAALRERLWEALRELPGVLRNGDPARAAPHLLNLSFEDVDGEALRASLPELAVSGGAACSSATAEPSYVLRALGRGDTLAGASLRFSFGRPTTSAEIDAAATAVGRAVRRLRALAAGEPAEPLAADDNPFGYSEPLWRLFCTAPRAGRLHAPDLLAGEARTRATAARLRLEWRLDRGRIADARFQAFGCPTTIATGAWIADWSIGRPLDALRELTAPRLRQALEMREDRTHCALLGEDAVRAALASPAPQTVDA